MQAFGKSLSKRVQGGSAPLLHKLMVHALVLLMLLLFAGMSIAAPYFRDTGLIDIPTGYVMQQGLFNAGAHTSVWNQKREELAVRIDFGMFNFVELELTGLKKGGSDYVMGSAKLLISRESGSTPSLSVGVDDFGEKISQSHKESFYGVLSKQFNLPVIHLISGHLGVGNQRYVADTSIGKYLHGVFVGLNKEFSLSFLKSQLHLMCEVIGKDLNVGSKYTMDSGLSVALAIGQLNSSSVKDFKYYLGVGFTNAPMMKEIDQSMELAQRAVKIANEARSDIDSRKESK